MKSLFALGAWCLTVASVSGVALAQFPAPQGGAPYWTTTAPDNAIGTGVATPVAHDGGHSHLQGDHAHPHPHVQGTPQIKQVPAPAAAPHVQAPHAAPQLQQAPAAPYVQPQIQQAPAPHIQSPYVQAPQGAATWTPTVIGGGSPVYGDYACNNGIGVAHLQHGGGWFGGIGGLFMGRDNANDAWLSVDDANITDKVMTTRDVDMGLAGGFEVALGRYFCDNTMAWQLSYWGLFPNQQEQHVYAGVDTIGNLGTSLTFDGVAYNGGNFVDFYNDEDVHRLRRNFDFHNVEWNIMGAPSVGCVGSGATFGAFGVGCGSCNSGCGGCNSCVSPWRWNWLAGIRYFQFSEGMQFSSDAGDTVFTGAPEEVHYNIDVDNHLIGFQVGGIANYCYSSNVNWINTVKLGVYGSHITHNSRMYGSAGTAAVNNVNSPYHGDDWWVNSTKSDVAMMGEWDTALTYQWSCNWRARVGYRAVAISGVAFAAEQIPPETFTDLGEVRRIDSNGSMILHGGYASLEFCY